MTQVVFAFHRDLVQVAIMFTRKEHPMKRTLTTTALIMALGSTSALAQSYTPQPQYSQAEQQGQQAIGLLLGALAVGIIAHKLSQQNGSDAEPEPLLETRPQPVPWPTPQPVPVPLDPGFADPHFVDPFSDHVYPMPVEYGTVPRICLEPAFDRQGYSIFAVDGRCLSAYTGFAARGWCEIEPGLIDLDCMMDRGWDLEPR